MNGTQIFWSIIGGVSTLFIVRSLIYNRGRANHRMFADDSFPRGAVWYHNGKWWTYDRRGNLRSRQFKSRSNPLDHPFIVHEEPVPNRTRRHYSEKEY